jgi:hypothetical protein
MPKGPKGRKRPAGGPHSGSIDTWSPRTELERTVFAALILAGEPVNCRRLAELWLSRGSPKEGCAARRRDPQDGQYPGAENRDRSPLRSSRERAATLWR